MREKYKVLPTLQLHLMHSPQLLSLLQPHWSSFHTWNRSSSFPLQDFHINCLTWTPPLLPQPSSPDLSGFVDMSLVPNLSKTHVLFSSSFPQSRAWNKGFCVSEDWGMKEKGEPTSMHDWVDHCCRQQVAWSPRTFWESYELHLRTFWPCIRWLLYSIWLQEV